MSKITFFTFFCLCFCLCGSAQAGQVVEVYVSIPPQKYFVEKIGGQYVKTHVMIEPGEIPETFAPSPRKLAALAQADLYFRMNISLEKIWISSIRDTSENLKIIDCCRDLLAEAAHPAAKRPAAAPPAADLDDDFHVWTNPNNAIRIANLIKRELINIDPARARTYKDNFREFEKKLGELDRFIRAELEHRRTSYFLVGHASWGHYAAAYGLKQLAVEKGNGYVGPGALSEIIRMARREKIQTLFVQDQINPSISQSLADEIGADLISLDPLAEDYINNLKDVTFKISQAIQ